ncbi:MAG TPA: cation:proton antiporter, partial [Pyrinomonadaceae bacterium]
MPKRPTAKGKALLTILCAACVLWLAARATLAAGARGGDTAKSPVHGLDPVVLIGLASMLLIAKLGGELFAKLKQPTVLGELVGGILVGGLSLFGLGWVEVLRADAVIAALAEIGVIILLFEVGLESNLREMVEVGWSSLLVALLGVVVPFLLGWGLAAYFLPAEATLGHLFIGATLCATSVGITARVLKDMGRLRAREARIILGAAVIDDVLGLLILAVVAGAIKASAAGETLALSSVAVIAMKSLAFLLSAILVGQFVVPLLFRAAGRLRSSGVLVTAAL